MTRALHRTYSEESNRAMESQTSPETESIDGPTTTPESESSNEGDGQTTTPEAISTNTLTTTDAPTTTDGDIQTERRIKDNDRKLEELLIQEILKKRIGNNL
ncbi:uncharacterized protein LOC132713000 [Ruditapes philippinarum]|uniref:uncharacterized protein LOC132713000 n=1 Tax=Ruditapes philippinarum TaxID=129788 RepID=UPI00295BC3E9|nr:uncharacterized protein LOC132713000 [Ruditapes philippinarum]